MRELRGKPVELFKDSALILIGAPVYLVLIVGEIIWCYVHGHRHYSVGGTLTNASLAALNVTLDLATRGLWMNLLVAVSQYRVLSLEGAWAYWVLLLVLQDFLFYWLHRVDHSSRLFWAVHATHHSSNEFNLTVGFRPSVLQPLYRYIWFLPLSVLGWRPEDILLMYSITQLYGVLLHTQHIGRLGVLEGILVTPSHHRVHHGSNPQYLDKNFGMLFIVWDRLFGTFEPEREAVRYGLNGATNHTNQPIRALLSPFRRTIGTSEP